MPENTNLPKPSGLRSIRGIAAFGLASVIILIILIYQVTRPGNDVPSIEGPGTESNALEPDGHLEMVRTELAALAQRVQNVEQEIHQGHGRYQQLQQRYAEIEHRLGGYDTQWPILERTQATLTQRQSQLEESLKRLQSAEDAQESLRIAQTIKDLSEAVAQLRAEHQQRFYRINALDTQVRQVVQVLDTLRIRLAALPSGSLKQTPPASSTDILPFTVTAIDRWNDIDTVTVAEPALVGRRHTVFLRQGESHLGWTLTEIKGRQVTFVHRHGRTLTATVEG